MLSKTKPTQIRLRRTKGWRMPPGTRSVTRSSRFGNRVCVVTVPGPEANAAAVAQYRLWAYAPEQTAFREWVRREFRGKNLACFCPVDWPRHADVLLEIANSEEPA